MYVLQRKYAVCDRKNQKATLTRLIIHDYNYIVYKVQGKNTMRLRALAKINLGLDVVCKKPDGYHEVRMIMQTINMYDQLDMEKAA